MGHDDGAASRSAGNLSVGGDHAAAIAAMTEAAALAEAIGADSDAAWSRGRRGLERLRAGDLAGAAADLTWARAAGAAGRSAGPGRAGRDRAGRGGAASGRPGRGGQHARAGPGHASTTNGALSPRLRAMALLSLARLELAGR